MNKAEWRTRFDGLSKVQNLIEAALLTTPNADPVTIFRLGRVWTSLWDAIMADRDDPDNPITFKMADVHTELQRLGLFDLVKRIDGEFWKMQ